MCLVIRVPLAAPVRPPLGPHSAPTFYGREPVRVVPLELLDDLAVAERLYAVPDKGDVLRRVREKAEALFELEAIDDPDHLAIANDPAKVVVGLWRLELDEGGFELLRSTAHLLA